MTNPYLELTEEFNRGRFRALLSSGQAVVMHRLAVMSKDGDWILRENSEAVEHVLTVLSKHGAYYRFGAPLDQRWLAGGWSSHLEIRRNALRLRTDFVSRPPRIDETQLAKIWKDAEETGVSVLSIEPLAAIKLTQREKDYPIVGELARQMVDPMAQLLYSRSGRDLLRLAQEHPAELARARAERPLLAHLGEGRERLEEELDRERRALMRADEARLARYEAAAESWATHWPALQRSIEGLPLLEAHRRIVEKAEGLLPFQPAVEEAR